MSPVVDSLLHRNVSGEAFGGEQLRRLPSGTLNEGEKSGQVPALKTYTSEQESKLPVDDLPPHTNIFLPTLTAEWPHRGSGTSPVWSTRFHLQVTVAEGQLLGTK